jgi:hypothetical protein
MVEVRFPRPYNHYPEQFLWFHFVISAGYPESGAVRRRDVARPAAPLDVREPSSVCGSAARRH